MTRALLARPRPRSFQVAHRIAARYGPQAQAAYLLAVQRLKAGIDDVALASAVASGSAAQIVAAIQPSRLGAILAGGDSLQQLLTATAQSAGRAGQSVLSGALGVQTRFNAVHPNVVMYARNRSAALVVAVTEDVREAIRIITTTGAVEGLTTAQQARAIREIVGLPPNWAAAPANLARELREGRFTSTRRLSAADKAAIRKALREGTVTEEFVETMQARYAASLTNRRALNIARTETLASANNGMRQSWAQAQHDGDLPATARRHWIVTPDDRLRDTHAEVPGMNPDGVEVEGGWYATPLGAVEGPPLETNCRCGEGLLFPGRRGML